MTQCLAESDVKELAELTLLGFDQRVAALPENSCLPFHQEAMRLNAELLTIYRVVVQLVRKEDDLERVASWWGTMVVECDRFAERLQHLSRRHQDSGAEAFYDSVLDLRNKCQRLRTMHT